MNRAVLVAAGILASRLSGLIRLRAFAHYFGLQSDAADAFHAAFRIPNLLQNLFGEGALSASFIPAHARLLAAGDRRTAGQLAGAVGALLALVVSLVVLAGVLAAPALAAVLAPGFTGEKRALTVSLVRVLFPGAGLLVLAAWCLGILNSHQRFFLSYAAPVAWNGAMIAALVAFGGTVDTPRLAVVLAWGSVAGSAMQVIVQLPAVLRLTPGLRFSPGPVRPHVGAVLRAFLPALLARGVMQISAFVDTLIATLLPTGALTGLANAQLIYTLPVSLFGMSVAASELPAMAGAAGQPAGRDALRVRIDAGLRRIAYFVVPSAAVFVALGDVVAAALLQTGRFRPEDAQYVWGILAGSGVGLLAATLARLYASAYFALQDTRTPLRYALLRVSLSSGLGYGLAVWAPGWLGVPARWGAAGLTVAGGLAAWVELVMLRRTMHGRVGRTGLPQKYLAQLWASAACGVAAAWGVRAAAGTGHPVVTGMLVLGAFTVAFLGATAVLDVPESKKLVSAARRWSSTRS